MLIFGGSLGADRINDTVIGMLDRISKDNKIELLFGTGDRNYDKIMNKIKESGITLSDNIKILEKDLTSDALYDKIMSMVSDKDRLKEMSENLKPLAKVDALEKIYELMIKMAKGDRK